MVVLFVSLQINTCSGEKLYNLWDIRIMSDPSQHIAEHPGPRGEANSFAANSFAANSLAAPGVYQLKREQRSGPDRLLFWTSGRLPTWKLIAGAPVALETLGWRAVLKFDRQR